MGLRRRPPQRDPKPVWLLLCEGEVTEPDYLQGFSRMLSLSVEPKVKGCGRGLGSLIEQARREKKSDKFDQIWCVADVDHLSESQVKEKLQIAEGEDIRIALSNPCFELWVLLHFESCNSHVTKAEISRRLKRHLPTYVKSLPFDQLESGYKKAVARASKLVPPRNPSTSVWRLTELLRGSNQNPASQSQAGR